MAKGLFMVPCAEHEGDMIHFENIIRNNGGTVINSVWDGTEDDDAYIYYSAPTKQQVEQIKQLLEET